MNDDQNIRSPIQLAVYAHSICLMGSVIGYQIGLFNSFFEPFADEVLKISDTNLRMDIASNLNFSLMFGIFLNSFIGGAIIELIGRHRTLVYTTAACVSACLIMLVENLYAFYLARFIFGFCGGFGFNLSQIIFKEILPNEMGKKMGNMFYIYHTVAIMISYAFGSREIAENWRYVFCLPLVFEVPKLILYLTILKYESPIWLKTHSTNIEKDVGECYNQVYNSEHASKLLTQFLEGLNDKKQSKEVQISIRSLFSRAYIRPFLICIFVAVSNQTSGIAYLVFYSRTIYQTSGLTNTTILTFFMGSMNMLAGVFITFMSGRFSKRENLILGTTCSALSYAIMLFGLLNKIAFFIVLGSYCFMFFFGISLGGSMFPYFADAVPPLGLSFASSFVWLFNCLNTKFGLLVTSYFGVFNLFFACMGFMVLAAVVLSLYSVETKNKTLVQIQEDFLRLKL